MSKIWAIEVIDKSSKKRVVIAVAGIESIRDTKQCRIITTCSGDKIETEVPFEEIKNSIYKDAYKKLSVSAQEPTPPRRKPTEPKDK